MCEQTFCTCIAQLNFAWHCSFCIVLALYSVLYCFYYLNNTYNCSGHCDYACGTEYSAVVLHAYFAVSHMRVLRCSTCVYCNIPCACTVTSHVHVSWHFACVYCMCVPQCPAFMYCSMLVLQCCTCCPVILSIGLFAMVFYLPALLMYCNIPRVYTTASHVHVP